MIKISICFDSNQHRKVFHVLNCNQNTIIMIKNILIPTDFSDNAKKAFEYGKVIAKAIGVEITLLHSYHVIVVSPEVDAQMIDEEIESLETETEENFSLLSKELQDEGIKFKTFSSQGLLLDEIDLAIDTHEIDMIIMGTKGAGNMMSRVLGSNTEAVLNRFDIPIWIIPEDANISFDKACFASNFEDSDFDHIKDIDSLLNALGTKMIFAHISEDDITVDIEKNMLTMAGNVIDSMSLKCQVDYRFLIGDDISESIHNFVKSDDINLLILNKVKRNWVESLFHRSLSNDMAYNSHIPVLIYHTK